MPKTTLATLAAVLIPVLSLAPLPATTERTTAATIDLPGFLQAADEVERVRPARLVDLDRFLQLAADAETIVLDSRSRPAYDAIHLAGAIHLDFSDMTKQSLARTLGASDRRILIYCNNNFESRDPNLLTKAPAAALNLSTFVALWAYGYRNVYELGELLELDDPRLEFEGLVAGELEN